MMAARNRQWTPQVVRDRIRVSMLVKRLQKCGLGKSDMTATQMRAIEILLKKTLPDLQAVENTHIGDAERPIIIQSADGEL